MSLGYIWDIQGIYWDMQAPAKQAFPELHILIRFSGSSGRQNRCSLESGIAYQSHFAPSSSNTSSARSLAARALAIPAPRWWITSWAPPSHTNVELEFRIRKPNEKENISVALSWREQIGRGCSSRQGLQACYIHPIQLSRCLQNPSTLFET